MDKRLSHNPKDWFPIEMVVVAVLIRIQQSNATDRDRRFCRSVFDRICRRGYGMEPRPLMRQVLEWSPYRITRWVNQIKGRYLFDDDVEILLELLKTEDE